MSGDLKVLRWFWRVMATSVVALGVAGCDEQGNFSMPGFGASTTEASDAAAPLATDASQTRDVEAPEIFQVDESGLWDGRPSLGGVWVAHPDVSDPERVIIRNASNGQFVIGALFRRERDNPGPALQVSSDAAAELGMLAGAPAPLSVTALRREEGPAAPAAAVADFDNPIEITATPLEDITATPLDPIDPLAGAAAAIDAGEAQDNSSTAAIAPAAVASSPPPPAPVASGLEKPFIQIGIFSIESNASNTAERLRSNGLSAQVLAQESQGKPFWRVIVGPAPSLADRDIVLAKIKSLGFDDAYAVTN